MVNEIEELQEFWDTLDTCFDRPKKYIAEALDPIVKFKKYRAFENGQQEGARGCQEERRRKASGQERTFSRNSGGDSQPQEGGLR
jgi:hypothetical protein